MNCILNLNSSRVFTQSNLQQSNHPTAKMMLRFKAISSSFSFAFSPSKQHLPHFKPSFLSKSTSISSSSIKMSSETIEHIVLFKTKVDTDPAKVNAMISNLHGLTSLEQVVHLTAGPIHKNRSTAFSFTHMLHSRYNSKEDLSQYSAHPSHMSVVRESVLPICEDIMAVDWVNSNVNGPLVPKPGSVMRITFMKLKEGLGDDEKNEILAITNGVKEYFAAIEQSSVGENFSPARAKGFSIASIAIYPGLNELEAADSSNLEIVAAQKEKARQYLDSVIVLDYVIPSSSQQAASL